MKYRIRCHEALVFSLFALSLVACDKDEKNGETGALVPATTPTVSAVRSAAAEPLVVRGEVEGVLWKHEFDANLISDIVLCGDRLYTATRAGRVVQWNPRSMTVESIAEEYGAVTAVDAAPDGFLIGSALGTLSTATCDLGTLVSGPKDLLPVQFTSLDPRSKTRALTIFREKNKDGSVDAIASLVDLRSGKSVHEPFETPQAPNAEVRGFVDYRGELWMALSTRNDGSKLLYLERFDIEQQGIQDLGADFEILGLGHVKRQVWAFGARADRGSGFITRVDSGRSQVKWDGEKAWFGAPPGGEVPAGRPVTYVLQTGESLLVFVPDGIYRTDIDLRRWKRLVGPDLATQRPFASVGGHVQHGDEVLVASAEGLVRITDDGWELSSVPSFPRDHEEASAPASAIWGERRYTIADDALTVSNPLTDETLPGLRSVESPVALAVDPADRLWVVTPDEIHVFDDPAAPAPRTIDASSIGVDLRAIESTIVSAEDAVGFRLSDGSSVHFRIPK